jgi:hypothetical protein
MSDRSIEEEKNTYANAGHPANFHKTKNYNTVDERRRAALREIDEAKFS